MNSTQNYGNDKILSRKSDSGEVQITESESENPRLTKGETRYCIFDKYKLIFVSLEIFSMGETEEEVIDHKRTLRLELADTARLPIQVRLSPAAFSGFSRRLLSTFQLLPSGLPMPSENWDTTSCVHPLHYLPSERRVAPCPPKARSADFPRTHALSYRPENGALIVTPHRQVSSLVANLRLSRHGILYCFCQARHVMSSYRSNSISSRVTLDFGYMRIGF